MFMFTTHIDWLYFDDVNKVDLTFNMLFENAMYSHFK